MIALARKVRERGHDIFFTGLIDCEPVVRNSGFEFQPFGERRCPVGFRKEFETGLSTLHGLAAMRFVVEKGKQGLDATVCDAPPVIREAKAEAIVSDQLAPGGFLVAAHLHLPLIHISCSIPGHQYNSIPPAIFGWPYRSGTLGHLRNRIGYSVVRRIVRPLRALAFDHSRRLGVPYDLTDYNGVFSRLAQISQLPSAFDYPNPELPPWFHYTGPFQDGLGRRNVDFPWGKLTGEPLIYASMGSILSGGLRHVFQTIAEGCSDLGCQLVVALGANTKPDDVGPFAGNCLAVGYAPQLELLRRASLCITHAGLNTALESLTAGVPMVTIPVTSDQPAVAARIAYTGAGTVIPYRQLSSARVRRAVRQVLNDGRYRENAKRLQAAIQAANGLERAADIIERCLMVEVGNARAPGVSTG